MNPKELQDMLDEIHRGLPFKMSPGIQDAMDNIQQRMRDIYRQQENMMRRLQGASPLIDYSGFDTKARRGSYSPTQPPVNPIPPSQRAPAYPKPDPVQDAARAERIKKEEEERADKERRSKIPGGFDIWDD